MHHAHPQRLRPAMAALSALQLAAAAPAAALASAAAPVAEAGTAAHAIVGNGIGYGVDADGPNSRVVAQAATSPRGTESRGSFSQAEGGASWLPYTSRGYVGLDIGQSAFDNSCGAGGFACKDARPSLRLYTGGMFNHFLGLELGYQFLGRAERGGGRSEAQGIDIGLVGRLQLGPLNVFAKAGLGYGRTRVSASAASLLPTGTARGWGGTYGAGIGWDLSPWSTLVLEWASLELRFAGAGKQAVQNTSVGFMHHF